MKLVQVYQRSQGTHQCGLGDTLDRQAPGWVYFWRTKDQVTVPRVAGDLSVGADPTLAQDIALAPQAESPGIAALAEPAAVGQIGVDPLQFKLVGFTSGCVCIRPELSTRMLRAVQSRDFDEAEAIREQFAPLEQLRNDIHPIRVLHEAVALAGIAETGPILPMLSELSDAERDAVRQAVATLISTR